LSRAEARNAGSDMTTKYVYVALVQWRERYWDYESLEWTDKSDKTWEAFDSWEKAHFWAFELRNKLSVLGAPTHSATYEIREVVDSSE
jgi:hypothetical protein